MALKTLIKFAAPKPGNAPHQNEDTLLDAWPEAKTLPARIVLSDGASESAFARQWSEALAWAYLRNPELAHRNPAEWLAVPQQWWSRKVPWDRIPWHGRAKTEAGAHATLLGISIAQTPDETGARPWQAIAVGDTCLFVQSRGETAAFPLTAAQQFNNSPGLVCSNPQGNPALESQVRRAQGALRPGDLLSAATDALSQWILARIEAEDDPWNELLHNAAPQHRQQWLESQRDSRTLRHDDIAFIAVQAQE